MNAIDPIKRLHQCRAWVNENLWASATTLNEEQLRQNFPIGQGSIWKTLIHLYAAEFVWLESLLGDENPLVPGDLPGKIPGNQLGSGTIASLAELVEKWRLLQQKWEAYLSTLTAESLDDIVYKIIASTGQRWGVRRLDILLHVCTHAQYTSAQVVNMLRHSGVQPLPDTMLITLARQEPILE